MIAKQRGLPNYDAVIDDGLNLETPYEAVYALGDLPPPNRVSSGMSSIAYPDEMDEQQGDGSLEEAVDAALMSVFG